MNVTLSNMDLVNARDGINFILRQHISRKAQLKVLQIRRWLEGPLEALEVVRKEIEDEHAIRDASGNVQIEETGNVKVDKNKFLPEWRAVLRDDQDYENVPRIKASLFGKDDTEDSLGEALALLGEFLLDDMSEGEE